MVLIWGLCAILLIGALSVSARSNSKRVADRAGYLDKCLPLFAAPQTAVAETGFARISGRYRGQMFDVQMVPDSLSPRKLPCLWLLVTLAERLPVAGTFDVMLRATGAETFSKFGTLPDQISVPDGFPIGCSIRTDAPGAMPGVGVVGRYMAGLDARRLKEVVVAEAGVRVVWLVEEADRGRYLLFRDAEMGAAALSPEVLRPLMDGLFDMWAAVRTDLAPKLRVVG